MIRVSIRRHRDGGPRAKPVERLSRGGERATQKQDFGEVDARVRPCPHCGMVHGYDCRKYVLINIVAALWIAASLLILIALLPAVVR
jgi:hypothetical protein